MVISCTLHFLSFPLLFPLPTKLLHPHLASSPSLFHTMYMYIPESIDDETRG